MNSLSFHKTLWNNFIEERDRWFCWIPFFIGLGVISSAYRETLFYCLGSTALIAALLMLQKDKLYIQAFAIGCAFWAGFITAEIRSNDTPLLKTSTMPMSCKVQIDRIDNTSTNAVMIATIKEWPEYNEGDFPLPINSKVRLTAKGRIKNQILLDTELLPSCQARVYALFITLKKPQYLGDYDMERIYALKGISASGILLAHPEVTAPASRSKTIIHKARSNLNAYFRSHLQRDQYTVACALITGESLVNQKLRDSFADAGMAHILAISGLHLCILGGLIFVVFRWILALLPVISLKYDTKKFAAIMSFIATVIYLFISGNKVPATRALVVYSIMTLGILAGRQPISMRSLSIAASFIIMFQPESIFLPGFQMSFAATAALIAMYESSPINRLFDRIREKSVPKLIIYGVSIICSTIAASLSVVPFTVNSFNKFTINSIPSNVIAIPLVGFVIIPALVLAIVFWGWPFMADFCFTVVGWGINQIIKVADFVSIIPGSQIASSTPNRTAMAIFVISFLWLVIWRKKWSITGFFGITLSLVAYIVTPLPILFIHEGGKAFAVRSKGQVLINTRVHARNTIKHWALSVGCNKIKKVDDEYLFVEIGSKKLLLIPYDSMMTEVELSALSVEYQWLIDLRPAGSFPKNVTPVIINSQLEHFGSLSIYANHESIETRDRSGKKIFFRNQ